MSSSVSNHGKPKQRTRQTARQESKAELDPEKSKTSPVKEIIQKGKRSSSLSKSDQAKVRESPQKSRSVDRNVSNRYSTQNISIKNSLVDTKRTTIGNKKNTSSVSISRSSNITKKADVKTTRASSNQVVKVSDKSRSPMKGPSGKTNVEIAKSFVKNASNSKKTKKEVKSKSTKKSSDKAKSGSPNKNEEAERPRTSTIRKGPPEINVLPEPDEMIMVSSRKNYEESSKNQSEKKSDVDDDEKLSYEEDFEDYDSDFEESDDSDSVSYTDSTDSIADEENVLDSGLGRNSTSGNSHTFPVYENISSGFQNQSPEIKKNVHQSSEIKKNHEKSFLRMSDRSSLSSNKVTDTATEKKIIKPSHSFINFASAVEQEEKKKYTNRVLKRASELLEIISLDDVAFNQIDIPPMKYDTYIRFFGKTDSKQVFIQTENCEDAEIQTDEIDMINKWTQNPPHENFGYGGDSSENSIDDTDHLKSLFNFQRVKLSSFIQNCSKVVLALLDEDFPVSIQVQAIQRRNELFYSDSYYNLSPPSFMKDVPVLNVYCSSEYSHYVLTIHDGIIKVPVINDERGVICVWNFLNYQKPEQILVSHSQPTCATFGPAGNDIIIAGMVDGTILLWDLSDNSQAGVNESLSLKSPTYSTAVIVGKENHHSCIVSIQALLSSSKTDATPSSFAKTNSSRNFHVLTLEDMGIVNIWVVVEVLNPDFSGFDTDLGLAPGGRLRLVRSSSLILYDLSALQEIQKINIRTFDFRLVPYDSSRILVTTDAGIVLHVNRQGGSADPRFYSSDFEFSSEVRCIVCSPHNEDLFLVGCSDGSAKLYNLKLVRPVRVFLLAAKGDPVTLIQWSPIHPAMFVVLSSTSNLYLWNLLEDALHPINSYHFPEFKVTWFAFCKFLDSSSQKSPKKLLHMFISRDDGETEVHIFKHEVTESEHSRQLEFMKNL